MPELAYGPEELVLVDFAVDRPTGSFGLCGILSKPTRSACWTG